MPISSYVTVETDFVLDDAAEATDMAPVAQQFPVPLGVYVVSVQRHSKLRRLHLIGNCPLVPGVDFLQVRIFGR